MYFDTAAERRGTNSVKWDKSSIMSICSNPDAEPFWVADMDFLPEEHAKAAGLRIAEKGVYGYPVFRTLEESASHWLKVRHEWEVPAEDISYSMGLLHGVSTSISLFTAEDARILVPSPMYRPFREITENLGRTLVEHNLSYDSNTHAFSIDRKRFREDASTSDAILFCSPQNPSGIVFPEEELEFILRTAKEFSIPVISDEIHSDLTHASAKHVPMGKANEGIGADVITLFAPSKTFNIAGEHCSFIVFSDSAKKEAFRKHERAARLDEPSIMIGELTEAVYRNGINYNRELCAYLEGTAEEMAKLLEKLDSPLHVVRGHASFVTFVDCSAIYEKAKAYVESHEDEFPGGEGGGILSRFFGVKASVCANDGTWFGPAWQDFVRFNYGTSRKNVLAALERMDKAAKSL